MSHPNGPYFDSRSQRWYQRKQTYNYQTQIWDNEPEWMPAGWSPQQQPPISPPSAFTSVPPGTPGVYQHHLTYGSPPAGAPGAQFNAIHLSPPPDPQTQNYSTSLSNFTGESASTAPHPSVSALYHSGSVPKTGKGLPIYGQFNLKMPPSEANPNCERIDPAYRVREKPFFYEGKVFAVILSENAGATATSYNSAISQVKYADHYVYTQTRRFVVVRQRREFCYACPIFTYRGKGTTKLGVRPEEHGVIYTIPQAPQLLDSEIGITKSSIGVHMTTGEPPLHVASRIYYGIHHPIQYNVRVKDVGSVERTHMPTLIGNWKAIDVGAEIRQGPEVTAAADDPELSEVDEEGTEEVEREAEVQQFDNAKGKDPALQQIDGYLYHSRNNPHGYDARRKPHSYHPNMNPYGFHPQTYPQGYHPKANPYGYHPQHNSDGYHPQTSSYNYHPKKNPQGYHAKENPHFYHPENNPYGYHPQANPNAYHVTYNQYGFHPNTSPYAWHPEYNKYGYHYHYAKEGYHPVYNPTAYHPTYNNTHGNTQASSGGDVQQGGHTPQYQGGGAAMGYQQGSTSTGYQQGSTSTGYKQGTNAPGYQQGGDTGQYQQGYNTTQYQQSSDTAQYRQAGSSAQQYQGSSPVQYQQASNPGSYQGSGTVPYQGQSNQADTDAQLSSLMHRSHLQ